MRPLRRFLALGLCTLLAGCLATDPRDVPGDDDDATEACDDGDGDGVCDADDVCPDGDDTVDADNDTIPDACDECAGFDDAVDTDADRVPDGCDPCPLDSPDDTDADGVCDSDDVCPDGDDTADTDADGVPDACDTCPQDALDDSDGDTVCDSDDVCPGFNDLEDANSNGTPDGCDPPGTVPIVSDPFEDYDVGADGRIALVWDDNGSIRLTCIDAAGAVVVDGLSVGNYDPVASTYPSVQISQGTGNVIVTWNDSLPDNGLIEYTYLDPTCQPLVSEQLVITVPTLGEFHSTAIDDAGRAVIAAAWNDTSVAFIDATGVATSASVAFDLSFNTTATHVAVNPSTGDGIVTTQRHSGNGIYYRRFTVGGTWVDSAPVQIPVDYHYWYDGHTVGMNSDGDFVLLWRADGDVLQMKFFDSAGIETGAVTRTTPDFEGWEGGHCYDSHRRRNQQIQLRGDNFVLGEVYNWITAAEDRTVSHFEYTPAGVLVTEDSTSHSLAAGLTLRLDRVGGSYVWGPDGIFALGSYP